MNAASRGVILAVAAVVLGVIILSQGFDDPESVATVPAGDDSAAEPADGGGDEGDDSAAADDTAADDSAAQPADDGGDDSAAADDTSADDSGAAPTDDGGDDSTAADDSTTEIPDVLHEPSEVRVLVVNGVGVQGAAGRVNNELIASGYNGLSPTNTNPPAAAEASSVYYEPGYELDARQLAQALNAPPTAVAPLPDNVPVDDLLEANVVIILGPDLVPTS